MDNDNEDYLFEFHKKITLTPCRHQFTPELDKSGRRFHNYLIRLAENDPFSDQQYSHGEWEGFIQKLDEVLASARLRGIMEVLSNETPDVKEVKNETI